jgi:hypothetical protein
LDLDFSGDAQQNQAGHGSRKNQSELRIRKVESSSNQLVVENRFLVARARKQAPKPKRAGRYLPDPPSLSPQRDAVAKGSPG